MYHLRKEPFIDKERISQMTHEMIQLIFVALVGLCVGSFANVMIHRIPINKSLLGRSHCPQCNSKICWYNNIPLFSYILLRGKCARCREPISIRYPLVEILNAILYVLLLKKFGISIDFAIYTALASLLLVISVIDLELMIIPNVITIPLLIVGLGISTFSDHITILQSITGAVLAVTLCFTFFYLGAWLFKQECLGGGDLKLFAALGAFLGMGGICIVFFLAFLFGLTVTFAIQIMIEERNRTSSAIAFGPFICLASLFFIGFKEQIFAYLMLL